MREISLTRYMNSCVALIERIPRRLRRGIITIIRVRQECLTYREVGRTFLSVNKLMIPRPLGWGSSLTLAFCLFQACTSLNPGMYDDETVVNHAPAPCALAIDSGRQLLYIAESNTRCVLKMDLSTHAVVDKIELRRAPNGLVLSDDGSRLYAACGEFDGTVDIIDTASGKTIASLTAGHTPCSPVLGPDGSILYVCNRFDNNVSVIDIDKLLVTRRVPALREPIAADITPDGRYLFIANHLPSGKRIREYISDGGVYMLGSYQSAGYFNTNREAYTFSAVVLVYDTHFNRLTELIKLPNGSTGVRGLRVSPDGEHVYVSHILARYHLPTSQLERGWVNTNALSVINTRNPEFATTVLLDDLDSGAANPWGIAFSADGSRLCVAHAGTHEISIIDRQGFHKRLRRVEQGDASEFASKSLTDVQNDLTFLHGIRTRISLSGNGPREIIISDSTLYAAEYFTGSIGVVSLDDTDGKDVLSLSLGPSFERTAEHRGEMYFNNANLCFQKWQSCASCHPDGRADGLNWDLLNDGIGNPKNTKSLLLSHLTPPSMAQGIRKDAETAVRAGLQHIHMTQKSEEVADAIDAYLTSMKPVSSPHRIKGKMTGSARRGRKVFRKAGCAECHLAPLYTDNEMYDVGTGAGREENTSFDTPALVEIWRTAPYLYNGRADTMYDVLLDFNKENRHGVTTTLNLREMSDLITFILSL